MSDQEDKEIEVEAEGEDDYDEEEGEEGEEDMDVVEETPVPEEQTKLTTELYLTLDKKSEAGSSRSKLTFSTFGKRNNAESTIARP